MRRLSQDEHETAGRRSASAGHALEPLRSAARIAAGYAFVQNLPRGHYDVATGYRRRTSWRCRISGGSAGHMTCASVPKV